MGESCGRWFWLVIDSAHQEIMRFACSTYLFILVLCKRLSKQSPAQIYYKGATIWLLRVSMWALCPQKNNQVLHPPPPNSLLIQPLPHHSHPPLTVNFAATFTFLPSPRMDARCKSCLQRGIICRTIIVRKMMSSIVIVMNTTQPSTTWHRAASNDMIQSC